LVVYLKIRLVLLWRCSKQNLIGGQKSTVWFQIKSPGQARPGRVDVHSARCTDHTLPTYSGRMLSASQRAALVGLMGYFEKGGRSALNRRDTFFHESVTSHQKTKTPITQIAPRTMAKTNIFFTLVAIALPPGIEHCHALSRFYRRQWQAALRNFGSPAVLNQAALVPLVLRSVYVGDRRMPPSDIPASPPKRDRFLPCGDPAWSNGADASAAQQRLAEATVPNTFKNHEARKRISLCSPYFIFPTCQARAFQEVHSAPQLDRPKIRPYAWWLIRCHARSLK
jgi:hypothetical protein